jgi:hypothetical protein
VYMYYCYNTKVLIKVVIIKADRAVWYPLRPNNKTNGNTSRKSICTDKSIFYKHLNTIAQSIIGFARGRTKRGLDSNSNWIPDLDEAEKGHSAE